MSSPPYPNDAAGWQANVVGGGPLTPGKTASHPHHGSDPSQASSNEGSTATHSNGVDLYPLDEQDSETESSILTNPYVEGTYREEVEWIMRTQGEVDRNTPPTTPTMDMSNIPNDNTSFSSSSSDDSTPSSTDAATDPSSSSSADTGGNGNDDGGRQDDDDGNGPNDIDFAFMGGWVVPEEVDDVEIRN